MTKSSYINWIDQICRLVGLTLVGAICPFVLGCNRTPSTSVVYTKPGEVARPTTVAPTPTMAFADRAIDSFRGIEYQNGSHANMVAIIEIVGGGVGCIDFDRDSHIDLFFPGGGELSPNERRVSGVPSHLLRGAVNWSWQEATRESRVVTDKIYSHGVVQVDYDHDGWDDILVYGYGGVVLLRNQGDGTFEDQTQIANLDRALWVTTAAWLDLNGDHHLDLYLGSYVDWTFDKHQTCKAKNGNPDVCSPNAFEGVRNWTFVSQSDGRFEPSTELLTTEQPAKSLGSIAAEFSRGQGVGLYVANDLVPNFYFTPQDGVYVDSGHSAGVAVDDSGVANGSMGVTLLDFNQDQRMDLFVTNFEHEMMGLYLGVDRDLFQHRSRQVGLNHPDMRVVGFGVVANDFDADGDEDVIFTGGHVHYFPDQGQMAQLPVSLQNDSGKSFTKLDLKSALFTEPAVGRGLATADFDRDGDMDLIATHLFGPPRIAENIAGGRSPWLEVNLVGRIGPRSAVGTTVELTAPGRGTVPKVGRTWVRQLYSGGSYLSQSQSTLHFAWQGVVEEEVELVIHWPWRDQPQRLTATANQILTVVEEPTPD